MAEEATTAEDIVRDHLERGYQLVTTRKQLQRAIKLAARSQAGTAFDFETTSLSPQDGRVRLASMCHRGLRVLVDFDRLQGGFPAVARWFEDAGPLVAFYSKFELRWFYHAGARPVVWDVWYARCAVLGGGRSSLAAFAQADLGVQLDKTEQVSNWASKKLTKKQLDYAFLDAAITWDLWQKYALEMDEGQRKAFHLFNDLVPGVIEMEDAGMALDTKHHKALVQQWAAEQAQLQDSLRELLPSDQVANLNSDQQLSDYFGRTMPQQWVDAWPRTPKSGHLKMDNTTLRALAAQAEPESPLREFLVQLVHYRKVSKYLSSFGDSLLTVAKAGGGRVHANFNIAAARTCRFSSSGPNLQNIPRDKVVRRSFAAGLGRVLVSLDYSGIELRVLALLAKDEQLLQDVVYGDVHLEVASVIAGQAVDKETPEGKAARTAAKAVSFGIIYGSGASGLAVTMHTTVSKAQDYIDYWSARYPRAFDYRHAMMNEARRSKFIRCVDGGTIYMGRRPELPRCANYPVQRAALSVMARAIIRHRDTLDRLRLSNQHRLTRMVGTVHDALLDETARRTAPAVLAAMERDMVDGYLDVFPDAPTDSLVEGGVGPNWAELG